MVVVVVLVNLVLLLVDYVLPGPSGEPNSALATTPRGLAAWAELAERNGIEVLVLREGDPPTGATIVDAPLPERASPTFVVCRTLIWRRVTTPRTRSSSRARDRWSS